jgi:hypothetical protein
MAQRLPKCNGYNFVTFLDFLPGLCYTIDTVKGGENLMTIIEYLEREIARAEADAKSAQKRGDATMDACWQGAAYALKGVLEFLSED